MMRSSGGRQIPIVVNVVNAPDSGAQALEVLGGSSSADIVQVIAQPARPRKAAQQQTGKRGADDLSLSSSSDRYSKDYKHFIAWSTCIEDLLNNCEYDPLVIAVYIFHLTSKVGKESIYNLFRILVNESSEGVKTRAREVLDQLILIIQSLDPGDKGAFVLKAGNVQFYKRLGESKKAQIRRGFRNYNKLIGQSAEQSLGVIPFTISGNKCALPAEQLGDSFYKDVQRVLQLENPRIRMQSMISLLTHVRTKFSAPQLQEIFFVLTKNESHSPLFVRVCAYINILLCPAGKGYVLCSDFNPDKHKLNRAGLRAIVRLSERRSYAAAKQSADPGSASRAGRQSKRSRLVASSSAAAASSLTNAPPEARTLAAETSLATVPSNILYNSGDGMDLEGWEADSVLEQTTRPGLGVSPWQQSTFTSQVWGNDRHADILQEVAQRLDDVLCEDLVSDSLITFLEQSLPYSLRYLTKVDGAGKIKIESWNNEIREWYEDKSLNSDMSCQDSNFPYLGY